MQEISYAWNSKALSLYNMQKYQDAISCYDKVIEIDAGNIDAWNDKGRSLYNMQKSQDAISCYDKALEIDPRYVYPWNNKAVSFGRITKI